MGCFQWTKSICAIARRDLLFIVLAIVATQTVMHLPLTLGGHSREPLGYWSREYFLFILCVCTRRGLGDPAPHARSVCLYRFFLNIILVQYGMRSCMIA